MGTFDKLVRPWTYSKSILMIAFISTHLLFWIRFQLIQWFRVPTTGISHRAVVNEANKSIIINVHQAPSHSQSLVKIQQVKNLSSMSSQLSQLFQRELQPLTYRFFFKLLWLLKKNENVNFCRTKVVISLLTSKLYRRPDLTCVNIYLNIWNYS